MYPVLFLGSATEFDDFGIGVLTDCSSCTVTEERNGAYELEMTYPVDGIHYEEIKHSRIVVAKPFQDGTPQGFRIYKISKPINGIVTINAEHVSYQLNNIPSGGGSANSVANAFAALKNNAYESCPFTFWTNNTTAGTYTQSEPASIRSRLGGTQGSILQVFGGEYEWDNFTVKNWISRGSDKGVTLRYGKNITDIKQEENIESAYTGVCPFWKSTDGTIVQLSEHVLHAPTASLYPYQRTIVLDCSSNFENQPTESQLRQYAQNYMTLNNIGYPNVNIKVSFVALWQTEEYKEIAPLETVSLCDTVKIYYERLGIEATAKVIKTKYDVLLNRYQEIELGDAKSTLGDTLRDEIQDETRDKVSSQEMLDAIQRATALITGETGGYVRFVYDEQTELPREILIMNTPDIDTATKVWRWNASGLGYSKTGYEGTYGLAMTIDGAIVADFITSGTIKAVDIALANAITGYFLKAYASTGCFEWKMAKSEMDTNGKLKAQEVELSGKLTAGSAVLDSNKLWFGSTYYLESFGVYGGVFCNGYIGAQHIATHRIHDPSGQYYEPIISYDGSVDNIYCPGDGNFYGSYWMGDTEYACAWGVTVSDRRLKENIEPTEINALETVKKIEHVQFDWKIGQKKHVDIGFIANDLYEIEETLATPPSEASELYSVNELQMIALATKAIQELTEKVERLEKELEELKNGNAEN